MNTSKRLIMGPGAYHAKQKRKYLEEFELENIQTVVELGVAKLRSSRRLIRLSGRSIRTRRLLIGWDKR